jgi:hypothetical protein
MGQRAAPPPEAEHGQENDAKAQGNVHAKPPTLSERVEAVSTTTSSRARVTAPAPASDSTRAAVEEVADADLSHERSDGNPVQEPEGAVPGQLDWATIQPA